MQPGTCVEGEGGRLEGRGRHIGTCFIVRNGYAVRGTDTESSVLCLERHISVLADLKGLLG